MRILGVDPGSRLTGYGCVEISKNQIKHIGSGTIRLVKASQVKPFEKRLYDLYEGLSLTIEKFKPQVLVVEKIFFAKNVVSALKLGQARGVILLCGAKYDLELAEYNPTEVKSAIVGHGRASKDQVSKMVQIITGKREFATADASDALSLAICHAQISMSRLSRRIQRDARLT